MKEKTSPVQKALNLWAMILIVWAIYRAKFTMPEVFDEFIAKPLVFVLPVIYYIKNIDKKPIFKSLYLNFKINIIIRDLFHSLLVGGAFAVAIFLAFYIREKKIILLDNFPGISYFLVMFFTALATGLTEEILSRGFILKKLYEESKNIYSSTFFASVLFFFLHVPMLFTDPKINGSILLMFMTIDLLLSMINGIIFLWRKSLIAPILIHTFYNLIIGLSFI